ncbi:1751_t:CDS:2 [Cetraspora pellucida]|uniref:1751_t:CDS:1 n=1 Tax=Cetraspora pellucida TaxID=1433469 RepID=A0A9N9EN06_9GLOM|nr:1751_t:CDS:2 [Cetraspora pellucida]
MVKPSTIIKASNILAYLLFLAVNIIWGFGPNQGKSPYNHDSVNTYINPAFFTFYIWAIIHLFLAGFEKYPSQDKYELFLIHIPFSLYHAWIFVLTILTTFASFTPYKSNINDEGPTIVVLVLVIIALILMEVVAIVYIERFKDVAGASIIAWTLFGIAVEQEDLLIHWIALALMVLCGLHIFKPYMMKMVRKDSGSSIFSFK